MSTVSSELSVPLTEPDRGLQLWTGSQPGVRPRSSAGEGWSVVTMLESARLQGQTLLKMELAQGESVSFMSGGRTEREVERWMRAASAAPIGLSP